MKLKMAAVLAIMAGTLLNSSSNSNYFVYVGTYGEGIHAYRYNAGSGKLEPLGLVGKVVNPSFLASDKDYKYLYAASELDGNKTGAVAGFAINRASGALTDLNSRSSEGLAPCHLAVDHSGKLLIAANYTSGNVPVFPIEADGKLGPLSALMSATGRGPNKERQEGPHAHETVFSADNRFAYVPDLGLDRIRIYKVDAAQAKLLPNDPPFAKTDPGSGPRHIVLSHDGKFAYVIHELIPEVGVFARDNATGALTHLQTIPSVPDGFKGVSNPAEILLDRAGNYVYASNREYGAIAVFAVNHATGKLSRLQVIETGGTQPRGIELDPSGKLLFVGDQKQNKFILFAVDQATGKLALTDRTFDMPSPVSFLFVPVG
jgi:6-phosphogluconolactonase